MIRRILAGSPAAGARLTEREIGELAGCTHACAREVIHRLQISGAVRVTRRRGAAVIGPQDIDPAELEQVWRSLVALLERVAGEPLVEPSPRGDRWARMSRLWGALDRLGQKAGDQRLAELLRRIALQRAIVARAAR